MKTCGLTGKPCILTGKPFIHSTIAKNSATGKPFILFTIAKQLAIQPTALETTKKRGFDAKISQGKSQISEKISWFDAWSKLRFVILSQRFIQLHRAPEIQLSRVIPRSAPNFQTMLHIQVLIVVAANGLSKFGAPRGTGTQSR